ncbi:hypothetical protein MSG28_014288 [Choristoneura fumiferana]|uniref:Uncharacterized protein n=1 Tax=Choristoneura fumiferana TaxID=7141 RepID=A0ACC0JGR3_CHOFU|nr:hypothetical protein MSG28_014288 [Choristoneura fumiferana]
MSENVPMHKRGRPSWKNQKPLSAITTKKFHKMVHKELEKYNKEAKENFRKKKKKYNGRIDEPKPNIRRENTSDSSAHAHSLVEPAGSHACALSLPRTARQTVGPVDYYKAEKYMFRYLGQVVSFSNRQDKEIERRIENAWKSYWSMKEHMKGNLPLTLKHKLVDILKVCQRAMERSILGAKRTDRIRNTTLRSKIRIADVATWWVPHDGHRRQGRPRRRWRDDLDAELSEWPNIALDHREMWKSRGEAFAQQWDTVIG